MIRIAYLFAKKCIRGQALVEFAITVSLYLVSLLILLDLVWVGYTFLSLNYVVREGARFAILGKWEEGSTRETLIEEKIKNIGRGLGVKIKKVTMEARGVTGAGRPGDFVVLTATTKPGLSLTNVLNMPVNASVVTRNEYYPAE